MKTMPCPLHENCKNKDITPKGVSFFKTEECKIYDRKFWKCKHYRQSRKLTLIPKCLPKHIKTKMLKEKGRHKMCMGKTGQKVIVKDGKLIYYGHSTDQKRSQAYSFDLENLRFKQNRRNNGK